jgi:hypothetical protein
VKAKLMLDFRNFWRLMLDVKMRSPDVKYNRRCGLERLITGFNAPNCGGLKLCVFAEGHLAETYYYIRRMAAAQSMLFAMARQKYCEIARESVHYTMNGMPVAVEPI